MNVDYLDALSTAMQQAGLSLPERVESDGKLHRFKTAGDKEHNSWYVLHQNDTVVVGAFGCWKRQLSIKWCSRDFATMSKEDREDARFVWKNAEFVRKKEEEKLQSTAREKCQAVWEGSTAVPRDHPYLVAKGVQPVVSVRLCQHEAYPDWIFVPLQDETGKVHSGQFIGDDGTKRFVFGGRVQGCYHEISKVAGSPLIICEGVATGLSLFEATGWSVVAAMNCGNLMPVAKALRKLWPDRMIILAADNDQFTEDNPGWTKAREASKSIGGLFCSPVFQEKFSGQKPTDFNDLHCLTNLLEVKSQVLSAFPVHGTPIGDLAAPVKDDPTELIKHRFLCECGSLLITGPTGMGKSSFVMQAIALWSNCLDCFGIQPSKPLTSVLIQAENDDGDLAEMRDGVATGLQFNEHQRRNFFSRVLVFSSNGLTGARFCKEVLSPILALHKPNLVCIDPAFSFLGGDAKEQKAVGEWLRGSINPLLTQHRAACIMIHHTNKPATGKDKPEWRNGEMAYTGSGSAEWANWARGILSLQSTGTPGVYKLHASKRGPRLGWRDAEDSTVYEKIITHSKEKGVICWSEGDGNDVEDKGRGPAYKPHEIADLLEEKSLTTTEFSELAKAECGLSNATFYRFLKELEADGRVLKSKVNRKWTLIHKNGLGS